MLRGVFRVDFSNSIKYVLVCLVDLTIDRQTDSEINWDATRAFIREEDIIICFA